MCSFLFQRRGKKSPELQDNRLANVIRQCALLRRCCLFQLQTFSEMLMRSKVMTEKGGRRGLEEQRTADLHKWGKGMKGNL